MNQNKQNAISYIDNNSKQYTDISHSIWGFAELSLKEFQSAALYVEALKQEGFTVETGLSGIETAFSGSFTVGGGGPVIGILGEFDALSGLSQKACSTEREEIVKNGSGHGCGHNMLGAASFAAACGVKHYLEQTGTPGTVIFYGCPGEEGGAAKAFMAREGVWKKLDAALSWHPGSTNEIMTGTNNSCTQVLYKFKGVAAHAAGNPEEGRSALDAVELMNIGVNYLREHMKSDCRIHYAMVDGGGVSPNVVQPHASVLYMVRSCKVADTIALQKRVDLLAKGAAIMTETTYERIFVDGTANTVPNTTLEKVLYANMEEVPLPEYTAEEWQYAKDLRETFPVKKMPMPLGAQADPAILAKLKELTQDGERAINDFLVPFYSGEEFRPGSTDVGDVSWLTPTAQFTAATWPSGNPGHSWQNVSCGASTIGDKGLIYAAKVLCGATIDLLEQPETLAAAKKEFIDRTGGNGYVCPIEADAVPYVIEE